MTEPLLETVSLQGLRRRIAWVFAGCWVAAIGILLTVALYEGHERRTQELDSEMSMRATLVYGLGWFDPTGVFHSEILDAEPWAHDTQFPLRVLAASSPPELLYGPPLPTGFLAGIEPGLATLSGPNAQPWTGDFLDQRVYAIALLGDENPEVMGYAVITSDARALWAERLSYSAGLIGVSLVLALLGLVLARRMARMSVEPLEGLLQGRARFVARAAHELRTPLATIESVAASGAAGDEPAERALRRIIEVSDQATSRVDSLLWHARLSSGVDELRREPTRVDLLVESMLDDYPHAELVSEETTGAIDMPLFEVALRNLFENAERHGGAARGRGMRVRVAPSLIEIRDQGPGFPPEFSVGQRSPHGTERGGVGLGLEITKEVARLHDGRLAFGRDSEGNWVRIEFG